MDVGEEGGGVVGRRVVFVELRWGGNERGGGLGFILSQPITHLPLTSRNSTSHVLRTFHVSRLRGAASGSTTPPAALDLA
jgi:hypothetical protein